MRQVHLLKKEEIETATGVIFDAFINDPMMLWLFGGAEGYTKYARFAIKAWVRWSILYGLAIATENCEAVALRKKPGKQSLTFWTMFRSGMLSYYRVLGKEITSRFIQLGKIIDKEQRQNMGQRKFWYCWVIAVKPEFQGCGYGRVLMQYTFNLAAQDRLPCYLETATRTNLLIHGHNGFRQISETKLPDSDVILYSMYRS